MQEEPGFYHTCRIPLQIESGILCVAKKCIALDENAFLTQFQFSLRM